MDNPYSQYTTPGTFPSSLSSSRFSSDNPLDSVDVHTDAPIPTLLLPVLHTSTRVTSTSDVDPYASFTTPGTTASLPSNFRGTAKRTIDQTGRHSRGRKLPTLEKRGDMLNLYDQLVKEGRVRKTQLIKVVAHRSCVGYDVAWRTINKRAVYEAALDWVGKSLEERRQKCKGGRKKRKAGRGVKFIQAISQGKYPRAEEQVYNKFVLWRKDGKKVKSRMLRRAMRVAVEGHYGITSFTGSQGWVRRFMKRHNIVFRRRQFNLIFRGVPFLFFIFVVLCRTGTTRRKRAWQNSPTVFAISSAPSELFVSRRSLRQ